MVLPAAFIGPRLVTSLREGGIQDALRSLAAQVSDADFERAFGAGKDRFFELSLRFGFS